ncbi:hypothetical protein CQ13_37300 [Bradyrhizobium retamae]|uniref:Uncharacterized protein n=1 Tax=Bradyrhizobium retamae TaxID=1300035 RepID=A0A0R3MBX9_9BRAD|nr:hypothetical protein CQ13_37300 [Bradyrhizobium retamae]
MVKGPSAVRATREIKELAERAALTQANLAKIGKAQPYLCKLLKESHIASSRVQRRVREMLEAEVTRSLSRGSKASGGLRNLRAISPRQWMLSSGLFIEMYRSRE